MFILIEFNSMYISPINSYDIKKYSQNKKPASVCFGDHRDLARLRYHFPKVTQSCFFRRGDDFSSPSSDFKHVANVLKTVFSKDIKTLKRMLIAGIGNSQEPFSYLAVINSQNPQKPLNEIVDMYAVDLQSLPNCRTLFKNSIYNADKPINYAEKSFITDDKHFIKNDIPINRVKNSIYYYLLRVYNNFQKSKWETPIQTAIKTYDDNFFDIISANNILPYVKLTSGDKASSDVLREMHRCLTPGGYLITDPKIYRFTKDSGILEKMQKIENGIYKK